jgi:hypothetical protein
MSPVANIVIEVLRTKEVLPVDVRTDSVLRDSKTEAEKFKWYRSEEAGRDLGEPAIYDWVHRHWNGYLRQKWLEHIQGKMFWIELGRCEFGVLKRQFHNHQELLNQIVEKLKVGQENLDVIRWALSEKIPLEPVQEILTAVDVNSCHLIQFFENRELQKPQ